MPRTPARVRLVRADGTLGSDMITDAARVEVVQYNRIVVDARAITAARTSSPHRCRTHGCANANNIANMAASVRDLTDPRDFHGSDGVTSADARSSGTARARSSRPRSATDGD